VKAPVADQTRLLVVQEHDMALHRLAHQLATMPAKTELAEAEVVRDRISEVLATAGAAVSDVKRELTVVEDEVTKVEQRRRRDLERLESGGGLSRELQALTAEVEALERRRDVLEDTQLEVMERLDEAQGRVDQLEAELSKTEAKVIALAKQVADTTAQIETEQAVQAEARAAAALGLDEAMMALYERVRQRGGGVGAAGLVARRCDGCRLEITPVYLAQLRVAAEDDVVRCEECGRILVRGQDSGL